MTNETRWNKRDKVWGSANSLFKWRFRSRRRRLCLSSLIVGTGSLCAHRLMLVLGYVLHCFALLPWPCFKMASDRMKWSTYVDSPISGTQGVNTTPFCAWVPRHWFPGTTWGQHPDLVTNRRCTENKVLVGVLFLASWLIWLWQYNIDPGEVLCPAVLLKTRVCGGCSVSQAHKTFLRSILSVYICPQIWFQSILSSVFLVTRLNILPHYFDVLVTIIAWLLVPETSGVHHFMHDDTLMVTAVS